MAEQKDLTARDISVIIKACKSAGVDKLEYGALKISFSSLAPVIEQEHTPYSEQVPVLPKFGRLTDIQTTAQDEPIPDDDDIDLLAVTDPGEWERRLTQDENG